MFDIFVSHVLVLFGAISTGQSGLRSESWDLGASVSWPIVATGGDGFECGAQ